MQNIHDIKVFACVVGVAISALLIYGLNRQWRWLIDPPEWMFAFYFPATVKITWGND
jgi:tellurite resistance protein TehA-like permease